MCGVFSLFLCLLLCPTRTGLHAPEAIPGRGVCKLGGEGKALRCSWGMINEECGLEAVTMAAI